MRALLLIAILSFSLLSSLAYGVAGGAGGGSDFGGGSWSSSDSGSSSWDSDSGSSFGSDGGGEAESLAMLIRLILSLPYPLNWIALFTIVAAFIWSYSSYARKRSSHLNGIPSARQATRRGVVYQIPQEFLNRNPGFSEKLLLEKIRLAFIAIQKAWTEQNLSDVRRWISDGIWQRFHTQFLMMKALGQINRVSDIRIKEMWVSDCRQDGCFDIVDVAIHFSARDDFVSSSFPSLNQCGQVEMVEYWSLIKKSGNQIADLYSNNLCPSCGAPLPPDMGEVARCSACHAISTLGDYDWILSEITQADDYAGKMAKTPQLITLATQTAQAFKADGNFSLQLIEDTASNAYMQVMAAQVSQQPERIRRFVDDALFDALKEKIPSFADIVFNRLYLNDVSVMDYVRIAGRDYLSVSISRSAQRVRIIDGKMSLKDRGLYMQSEIMVLARDSQAQPPKGSLYAHCCPSCGAPVSDTLDLQCQYCQAVLNSTKYDWIVTQLFSLYEFMAWKKRLLKENSTEQKTTDTALPPTYSVRDYALNNLMVIVASDGKITSEEKDFIWRAARQMKLNPKKLEGLFELAINGQLSLRLPEERQLAIQVKEMMTLAIQTYPAITPSEQHFLDEINERINAMPD